MANDSVNENKRTIVRSELDLQLMTTDSQWGRGDINPELIKKIVRVYGYLKPKIGKDGKPVLDDKGVPLSDLEVSEEGLWSLLGFYTRDMRLGNLNRFDGEVEFCSYYLDLANDYLQAGMVEPFLICLSRVATKLELSQSRGGFLRRRMNTLSHESINIDNEPKKANLFGKKAGSD